MPNFETIYQGELRTQATHCQSGTQIITDAPTDNHGKGEAFSPTDLVATALGSCMLTIMGIYARKESIALEGTQIGIQKIMAANPRRIAEIKIKFNFPAELEVSEAQKEKLRKAALTCPVSQSLHPDLKQTVEFGSLA